MMALRGYLNARSVEKLWEHHTALMASYGFDRLFYAYTCFQTANTFSDPEDALVLTNHPADYVDAYVTKGLFRDGPMLNWATRNVGSTSWRIIQGEMGKVDLTYGQRHVADLNRKYGVAAGYTIAFPMAIKRAVAGIGLTARRGVTQEQVDALWETKGEEIEIINQVAHLCITQLPATGQSRVLTPRQSEVLELVADGKSVQDISVLLGRKPATVDKHLRGARDTLGVETTAQAVRKASVLNQIFVLEPVADAL
jgi:LuxR family transcriptional regulator, quorum-sensing system regulator SdiA